MGDTTCQLTHRVHFVHLAQIFLRRRAFDRFLLQPLIGIGQFRRACAHCQVQPVGPFRLRLR